MSERENQPLARPSGEFLPTVPKNRILILGSSVSGAFKLGRDFQAYLEKRGIPNPVVQIVRDAGRIEEALSGRDDPGQKESNLPRGVILLPGMRQHDRGLGSAMSLSTCESGIDRFVGELCETHGVPLVIIRKGNSPEQITGGLKRILGGDEHTKI